MKNKIKWGVIGSGGIARRRTIPEGIMKSDHAVLITVYDVNPDVNASIAEQYNIKAARSLADFLDKDINFLKDYGDNLPILL